MKLLTPVSPLENWSQRSRQFTSVIMEGVVQPYCLTLIICTLDSVTECIPSSSCLQLRKQGSKEEMCKHRFIEYTVNPFLRLMVLLPVQLGEDF